VPLYLFADTFQAGPGVAGRGSSVPIIGLPIANHDDNQHAANENLRLQNLWDGIQTYASLMADLKW
jgi:acetylornithine deacetylase/succinyl-diaminopimelate desuccinylase-like protein